MCLGGTGAQAQKGPEEEALPRGDGPHGSGQREAMGQGGLELHRSTWPVTEAPGLDLGPERWVALPPSHHDSAGFSEKAGSARLSEVLGFQLSSYRRRRGTPVRPAGPLEDRPGLEAPSPDMYPGFILYRTPAQASPQSGHLILETPNHCFVA